MPTGPRRQFLQSCGAAVVASLAACAGGDDPDGTTTASPTETATPAAEFSAADAWTADRLSGRVNTLLLPGSGPNDDPTGPLYAATGSREVTRLTAPKGRLEWTVTARGDEERDPALTVSPSSRATARSQSGNRSYPGRVPSPSLAPRDTTACRLMSL